MFKGDVRLGAAGAWTYSFFYDMLIVEQETSFRERGIKLDAEGYKSLTRELRALGLLLVVNEKAAAIAKQRNWHVAGVEQGLPLRIPRTAAVLCDTRRLLAVSHSLSGMQRDAGDHEDDHPILPGALQAPSTGLEASTALAMSQEEDRGKRIQLSASPTDVGLLALSARGVAVSHPFPNQTTMVSDLGKEHHAVTTDRTARNVTGRSGFTYTVVGGGAGGGDAAGGGVKPAHAVTVLGWTKPWRLVQARRSRVRNSYSKQYNTRG